MIPVFLSRYSTNLPEPYGAFVGFNIGERIVAVLADGRHTGSVVSRLRVHPQAPVIDSAAGRGRYVYEIEFDDTKLIRAVSAEKVLFQEKERTS